MKKKKSEKEKRGYIKFLVILFFLYFCVGFVGTIYMTDAWLGSSRNLWAGLVMLLIYSILALFFVFTYYLNKNKKWALIGLTALFSLNLIAEIARSIYLNIVEISISSILVVILCGIGFKYIK